MGPPLGDHVSPCHQRFHQADRSQGSQRPSDHKWPRPGRLAKGFQGEISGDIHPKYGQKYMVRLRTSIKIDPTNFAEVGIPLRNPPRRLEDSDGFAKRGEKIRENVGTKGGAKMWNPCFEWIVCEKVSSWTWAICEVLQILSLHVWSRIPTSWRLPSGKRLHSYGKSTHF